MSTEQELTRRLHLLADTTTFDEGALDRIQARIADGDPGPADGLYRPWPSARQMLAAAAVLIVAMSALVLFRDDEGSHVEIQDETTTTTTTRPSTTTSSTAPTTTSLPQVLGPQVTILDLPTTSTTLTVEELVPEPPPLEEVPATTVPRTTTTPPTTVPPTTAPDGQPLAVRLVGPDYDVRASMYIFDWPTLPAPAVMMGIFGIPTHPDMVWEGRIRDPGNVCFWANFPPAAAGLQNVAFGQVRADVVEIRAVARDGGTSTAQLGSIVIYGLRPFLVAIPDDIDHFEAYGPGDVLLHTYLPGAPVPEPATCPVVEGS